jgi:uncharacterized protein (DUF58 family)
VTRPAGGAAAQLVPAPGPTVLSVRVRPTRSAAVFALLLLVLLLGSVNYALPLGYAFTFLIASIGVVSTLHALRNLWGLRLRAAEPRPVFAGEPIRITVHLDNDSPLARRAVSIALHPSAEVLTDVAAGARTTVTVSLPTERRGRWPIPPLYITSRFPLGLVVASSCRSTGLAGTVYPRPAASARRKAITDGRVGGASGGGSEDFAGLREYVAGDALHHLAWKSSARLGAPLTKRFSSPASEALWLRWDDLPGISPEERLARLCRQVLDAEDGGRNYGLALPDRTIAPGSGAGHRHSCLEALASFGMPAESTGRPSPGASGDRA